MTQADFVPSGYKNDLTEARVTWESPSNIALVKYWGKREGQVPTNASISFTLDACRTRTTVEFTKKEPEQEDSFEFELYFEGSPKDSFRPKVLQFLERAAPYLPFLKRYTLQIHTENTFPHSSGIASSASGMSALALCFVDFEEALQPDPGRAFYRKKASFLARLGSGSACRSIEGGLVVWGNHPGISGSSDLYGISFPEKVHPIFEDFHDAVLIVEEGKKEVSSTLGHDLMKGHPFAPERFKQAQENISRLQQVLQKGDLNAFISIVEEEALSLHAMMMTSRPSFILMQPNTLEIIRKIRSFRTQTGSGLCFTLDAGANVHVLYPGKEKKEVQHFIQKELLRYCQDQRFISDRVGKGARKLH